jgi:hypothetical protein
VAICGPTTELVEVSCAAEKVKHGKVKHDWFFVGRLAKIVKTCTNCFGLCFASTRNPRIHGEFEGCSYPVGVTRENDE